MSTAWVDRYMEIPGVRRGRTLSGADCAGLYGLIVGHEAGELVQLPRCDAARDPERAARIIELEIITGHWRKIEGDPKRVARKFDAILMQGVTLAGDAADIHIGCATGEGTVVHMEMGIGVRHVPLDDPDIVRRIRTSRHGVYRPAFLDRDIAA